MKRGESGQGLVEYVLILVIVAVIVILPTSPPSCGLGGADVALEKEVRTPDGGATVAPGASMRFVLTVENQGLEGIYDVSVLDELPAGVAFQGATLYHGSGKPRRNACLLDGNRLTCRVPDLPVPLAPNAYYPDPHPLHRAEIYINVLAPLSKGTITNTATVTASNAKLNSSGCNEDAVPSNNQDSVSVYVGDSATVLGTRLYFNPFGPSPTTIVEIEKGGTDLGERIETVFEQYYEQDERLDEAVMLAMEAVQETALLLYEHAQEVGDAALQEQLSLFLAALDGSDLEAVLDAFAELSQAAAGVPLDIYLAAVQVQAPLLMSSCVQMNDAVVTFGQLDQLLIELDQLEQNEPGSTTNLVPILEDLKSVMEERNQEALGRTAAVRLGLDVLISGLQDAEDPDLNALGDQLAADTAACEG